jgi:hypothetical protein|tara:strand:+ start:215 stop:439 length:225 start_codon:yes stop_codon:yes gene_type:complete
MLLDITTLAILDCIMFTVVLTLGAILISLAPDEEEVIEEEEEEVQMPTSGSIGKVFDHMANERLLEKKERGDLD